MMKFIMKILYNNNAMEELQKILLLYNSIDVRYNILSW